MSKKPSLVAVALAAALLAAPAAAVPITYVTVLSGPAEFPPNASPGTGFAKVIIDLEAHTMSISASFSGLIGNTTNAHIHCCTAVPGEGAVGVATTTPTFPGFPSGVTAGTYDHVFDLLAAGSWNPGFVTANGGIAGAEAAFAAGLAAGRAYFNVHSAAFPGGEIRGFLQVGEPGGVALSLLALGALAALSRRRQR